MVENGGELYNVLDAIEKTSRYYDANCKKETEK